MIKKFAMLAAAGLLYVTVPMAPASAQGISMHVGSGNHHGGGYRRHGGYDRGYGYRQPRAYHGPRHYDRRGYGNSGVRKKVVIIR